MNETEKILKDGDKFLILLDSILNLINDWKENYVQPVEEKDVVPDMLDIQEGDTVYYVVSDGDIHSYDYDMLSESQNKAHRLFKAHETAEMYRDKTQIIADELFFKQLYDADFEPDWTDSEPKYGVTCNSNGEYCCYRCGRLYNAESVYFSSEELAQKCADWMNSRRKNK